MKKTILLLEDDENLNRGIAMRLEKEGYQVLPAFGMSQAKGLMMQHEVHLVITDIRWGTATASISVAGSGRTAVCT